MARKKQIHGKTRPHFIKKETSLSQEDETQIQQQLENYQDIVIALRSASTPEAASSMLEPLNALSEQAQISFAKALIQEESLDAADLLQGIYDFSSSKEVSKEARRSLLRLESSQIYPQWTAPQSNLFPDRIPLSRPSSSEAASEEEDDYFGGDFFGDDSSEDDSFFKSLLNKRERGADTSPLEEFDFSDLIADEVVEDFLAYWTKGAFDKAYTMLAENSPLRENLSLEQWVKRRRAWADQFHPRDLELSNYSELETSVHKLASLPGMQNLLTGKKPEAEASEQEEQTGEPENITVFWSLVLDDRAKDKALPEFPVATLINPESGRHWFWTAFVCVEEGDSWHVFDIIDHGARLGQTSAEDLQQLRARLIVNAERTLTALSEGLDEDRNHEAEEEQTAASEDDTIGIDALSRATNEVLSYDDLLTATGTADFDAFLEMYHDTISFSAFERSDIYSSRMLEQFPQQRTTALRGMASILLEHLNADVIGEELEKAEEIVVRAESKLREVIALEPDVVRDYIQLAEAHFHTKSTNANAEARQILEKAETLAQTPADQAEVQLRLARIADFQDDIAQALTHYQRVVELDPNNAEGWHLLAHSQQHLGHAAEAANSFQRYLALQPTEVNPYVELISLYREQHEYGKAHEILDKGLTVFDKPDALAYDRATINAEGALLAIDEGNLSLAQELLDIARGFDAQLDIIGEVEEVLGDARYKQLKAARGTHKQAKSSHSKKRKKKR